MFDLDVNVYERRMLFMSVTIFIALAPGVIVFKASVTKGRKLEMGHLWLII